MLLHSNTFMKNRKRILASLFDKEHFAGMMDFAIRCELIEIDARGKAFTVLIAAIPTKPVAAGL